MAGVMSYKVNANKPRSQLQGRMFGCAQELEAG